MPQRERTAPVAYREYRAIADLTPTQLQGFFEAGQGASTSGMAQGGLAPLRVHSR